MGRVKYKMPWGRRLLHYARPVIKPLSKLLVLVYAIRGRYPEWLLTPDDPVSPFGSGTTKTASREPTQMAVYRRFGRYVGDVVWLAWRNGTYGLAYWLKPDWLKEPSIRYEDLEIVEEREYTDALTTDGYFIRVGMIWLKQPDGTWLWETTRRFGPIFLITGYRLNPVWAGAWENRRRAVAGLARHPRPAFHPNMDARPLVSIRTAGTL